MSLVTAIAKSMPKIGLYIVPSIQGGLNPVVFTNEKVTAVTHPIFKSHICFEKPKDKPLMNNIMPHKEYVEKHLGSLDDYIKRMKPAFPDHSDKQFKEAYNNYCQSAYNSYVTSSKNPGNNIGLMLEADFFEDESSK